MKEKLKKILKVTGVGAIGFLLGVGLLTGVSMCSNNGKNDQTNKTANNQVELFNMNNATYISDLTGKTLTFIDEPSLSNIGSYNLQFTSNQTNFIKLTIGQTTIAYTDTNNITTNMFYYVVSGGGGDNINYRHDQVGMAVWVHENYRTISITGGTDATDQVLIDYLIQNSDLVDEPTQGGGDDTSGETSEETSQEQSDSESEPYNYTMPIKPNANAQIGYSSESFLVKKEGENGSYFFQDIECGEFVSNGETYDTIRSLFITGADIRYKNNEGDIVINQSNDSSFYFFSEILYRNSATDTSKIVYKRLQSTLTDSNGESHMYWDNIFTWTSAQYRTLNFNNKPSNDIITALDVFSSENNNIIVNDTINGGLGGAVGLFGEAFTGLTGIFSIEIFPNISLGILLFLPLISGIIIAIIWVLKR